MDGVWFPADNPIHPSAVGLNCGGHLIKTNWVMTCNWMEWPTETTQIDGQSVVDKAATIDDGVHCCRIYMERLSRCHGFTIENLSLSPSLCASWFCFVCKLVQHWFIGLKGPSTLSITDIDRDSRSNLSEGRGLQTVVERLIGLLS